MPRIRKDELVKHLDNFHKGVTEADKELDNFFADRLKQTLDVFVESLNSVSQSLSEPLLTKNPKVGKKKGPKISSIPENSTTVEPQENIVIKTEETESFNGRRTTRTASKRAMEQIQTQAESPKVKKSRLTKKQQLDKEDNKEIELPPKMSRINRQNSTIVRRLTVDLEESLTEPEADKNATTTLSSKMEEKPSRKRANETSNKLSNDEQGQIEEPPLKKMNTEKGERSTCSSESTFYEDAVEKHNILSSTMNASALMMHKKMFNPVVKLQPLPPITNDETFVVPAIDSKTQTSLAKVSEIEKNVPKKKSSSIAKKQKAQKNMIESKKSWFDSSADNSLITDDESDLVANKNLKKSRLLRSSLSDEDLVESTPPAAAQMNAKVKPTVPVKNNYKNEALFSPYLKQSVKKRVEAFEQVAASPQKEVATSTTTSDARSTRHKTRAMTNQDSESDDQKAENKEDMEDNEAVMKENVKKKTTDKALTRNMKKSQQSKYHTPTGKNRIPVPTSTSKMYTPTNHGTYNTYTKPLTASKVNNLVTNKVSLIPKSASKHSSIDSSAEKYHRKMSTDDVKQKRDSQLKAMSEMKKHKREMKEQKIREAREAKMKIEMEKRLKAEKEKEEKARLALLAQEKAREEAEKKRLANLQRLQEKEERRKQEQLLRLQKIQEQEELERQLLAEQRRIDQEVERRKLAEMRAMQQAQAEQMKQKMLAKKQAQKAAQNAYKLESDPESDDDDEFETKPKFPIPDWAQPINRADPLTAQSMIPKSMIMKMFNTKKCTPNLLELFKGISKNRVVRTSSAIWKSPPRFSRMIDTDD